MNSGIKIVVGEDPTGRVYVAHLVGNVEIEIDKQVLHRALRAAAHAYMFRTMGGVGGEGPMGDYVGGFWDVLTKVTDTIKKVTDIPLVRSIVSAIPYGGTVLAGLDLAGAAVAIGNKELGGVPAPARALASAAAKTPRGRKMLSAVAKKASGGDPGAIELMKDVTYATSLMRDVTDLRGAMRDGTIDSGLVPEGGDGSPEVGGANPIPGPTSWDFAGEYCPTCRTIHRPQPLVNCIARGRRVRFAPRGTFPPDFGAR